MWLFDRLGLSTCKLFSDDQKGYYPEDQGFQAHPQKAVTHFANCPTHLITKTSYIHVM